jgi:uncharacterized protein YcbK (DUF882 family)
MHHRRGTGRGVRGMTTQPLPVSGSPKRHPSLPLCAALAVLSLSGCVSATDPTLMAGNQGLAPSESLSLAPTDGSELAEGSAPGAEDNAAFSIAQTDPTAASPDSATMTAMADPAGIDARNRSIMQNGQAVAVSNLYSTNQTTLAAAATGEAVPAASAGEAAPGAPVPSPSPERQLATAAPVEVAALSAPAEQSPAAQALDQATASVPAQASNSQPQAAPVQAQPTQPTRAVALAEPPRKKSFFGRLFGSEPTPPKAVPAKAQRTVSAPDPTTQTNEAGETEVASLRNDIRVARASAGDETGGLPGVRMSSLFEIQAGNDEDGEDAQGVEVASAAGLARLAPNGLHVQTEKVDIACLKPQLVRTLKAIEGHYGRPVVVTSGFRSPKHNRKIGGARNSRHTSCEAADIQVAGISKWDLAAYVRSIPGRGGVGTYCHTRSVHVDIGTKRDWNWRCRRRK